MWLDLVTFTEEILNRKLYFLCSVFKSEYLFCLGRQDTSFEFERTRGKLANRNCYWWFCKQTLTKFLLGSILSKLLPIERSCSIFMNSYSTFINFWWSFDQFQQHSLFEVWFLTLVTWTHYNTIWITW